MKNFFKTTITITMMLGVIMLGHLVSAGSFVPGSITPPITTPPQFLDQSSTAQTKQGWLRLGGTGDPTTTLDVMGTAAANSIAVIGNTTVAGKLYIGANPTLSATDPALVISSGNVRSSGLVGIGDRPLCATATGVIKVCGASTPTTGVCGSANSTTPVATAPTTGLCSTGTASNVATGISSYNWTCTLGTTTPTACSVPKVSSTSTCGTVHTTTPTFTLTASSLNLCTGTITPNNFSSTDPLKYTWECWNAATSTSSMCFANKTATPSITWNSSACTSEVGNAKSGSLSNKYFISHCPEATYQGNIITTYDKEINGTVSALLNNSLLGTGSTPRRLGNILFTNASSEISYGGTPDLKAVRFRPKSGSTLGNWGPYKAYFTPDNINQSSLTKQVNLNSIQFGWALSGNENMGSLPKVISYRILACDPTGGFDCITIEVRPPGSTSASISRPVNIAFGTAYPYYQDTGSTQCTIVYAAGFGMTVPCEYYIQAYIASPFLPETTNTAGLVNKLSPAGQNPPVYYSSDIKKF